MLEQFTHSRVSEEGRWEINKDRHSCIQLVLPVGCVCVSGVHISTKKKGGCVTAVGSIGDVERCFLESSHIDGCTHKQRCRSKVPSVVTARVRPCQIALEGGERCLNDSVLCEWGSVADACRHSHEIPKTPEERRARHRTTAKCTTVWKGFVICREGSVLPRNAPQPKSRWCHGNQKIKFK